MPPKPDRRAALKLLSAAPLGLGAGLAMAGDALAQTRDTALRVQATPWPVEPAAGSWCTWMLGSGRELRLAAPPDEEATRAEIAQLRDLATRRDAAALDRIRYWDAGAPSYRWTERAVKYTQSKGVFGNRAQRVLGRLFPRDAAHFHGIADEVAESRIMGGIHYRTDCNVGLTLGRQVADVVWSRAGVAAS